MSDRLRHDVMIRCHRPHCMNVLTWENHRHGQLACDSCMDESLREIVRDIARLLSSAERELLEERLMRAMERLVPSAEDPAVPGRKGGGSHAE